MFLFVFFFVKTALALVLTKLPVSRLLGFVRHWQQRQTWQAPWMFVQNWQSYRCPGSWDRRRSQATSASPAWRTRSSAQAVTLLVAPVSANRRGANGVSTNGVAAIFSFFYRGTFWVPICSNMSKYVKLYQHLSTSVNLAYFFPNLSKCITFAATHQCWPHLSATKWTHTSFARALAMPPSGRNRSPASDLVLWRLILPHVFFSGGVIFQTPASLDRNVSARRRHIC